MQTRIVHNSDTFSGAMSNMLFELALQLQHCIINIVIITSMVYCEINLPSMIEEK